jgi:hypothetical protein
MITGFMPGMCSRRLCKGAVWEWPVGFGLPGCGATGPRSLRFLHGLKGAVWEWPVGFGPSGCGATGPRSLRLFCADPGFPTPATRAGLLADQPRGYAGARRR